MKAVAPLLRHIVGLLRYTSESDVVALHCNPRGLRARVAIVSAITCLFGKPLVVRVFGGESLQELARLGGSDRFIRTLRKVDLYLVETRRQVQEARDKVARVEWFPNHRRMPPAEHGRIEADHPCRRFVFIGHVKATKGILEIIEAGERFDGNVGIDVFGPFEDGMTEAVFDGLRRVHYRGVVEPDQVLDVLRQYDVLLLPTYYSGEGYPGIIIEAFSVGLPVITTRWRRLPELVDGHSGVLVEPRNPEALYQAMKLLVDDPEQLARLRRGSLERRTAFDVAEWSDRFVEYCVKVASGHK